MNGSVLIGHNDIAPYNVCVTGDDLAARRLSVIAESYRGFTPRQIMPAVPPRIQIMLDGIPAAAADGHEGMMNFLAAGEPELSRNALADLVELMPDIDAFLT